MDLGLTQDELSLLLKQHGLGWQRSHIAAIEAGNRESIELDTAVALARALDVPVAELVAGDGPVQLTLDTEFTRAGFREVLSQPATAWTEAAAISGRSALRFIEAVGERSAAKQVSFQADAELAARLGVKPEDVYHAAERLWGHNLHQERDRRIAEMGEMSAAQRRARRGHITRQLAKELLPHLPGGKSANAEQD